MINSFSFWEALVLITLVFLICSYTASHVVFKIYTKKAARNRWDFVNSILGIACSGFFILIIFTTLNAWNYMQAAREACSQEAAALIGIIRVMDYFADNSQEKQHVIDAAKSYTVIVRTKEWASMRHKQSSPLAVAALTRIFDSVKAYHPQDTSYNNAYYEQLLDEIHDLNAERHHRLIKMNTIIPAELQHSIMVGCLLLSILLGGLTGTHSLMKLLPVLFFDIVLAFNVVLCFSLNYPFSGLGVSNHMFYSGILADIPDPQSRPT